MKLKYPALLALFCASTAQATSVFINEIHYDNAGGDVGEFIEIAAPQGTLHSSVITRLKCFLALLKTKVAVTALLLFIPPAFKMAGQTVWHWLTAMETSYNS